MSGIGRKALYHVREWSEVSTLCPGVVGWPSQMSGSFREVLSERPGVVGRSSRKSRSGREDLPKVREWSGGPPGSPGVVGRSSQKFGSGREVLTEVWE